MPSNTVAQAANSNTLLTNNSDSRDIRLNFPPTPTFGARHAYSVKEPPMTIARNIRMYRPRRGSVANA